MHTTENGTDTARVASELRVVLGQLVRRLRAEKRLPIAHGAVLGRLDREGPRSASELATAERVRPQSMAQTLGDLEREGLIVRTPHPTDRRSARVTLTPQGLVTLQQDRAQSQGWLEQAISEHLSSDERAALTGALALLRTLADS
jgi:DNA-binding MarR family transcriptional regulator